MCRNKHPGKSIKTALNSQSNTSGLENDRSQFGASWLGFTLIEVLIVVAILSIVAAVALPSFSQYMTDSRRTDAIAFLTEIAGEQQRYFSEFNQYATDLTELNYPTASMVSPEGYYTVSITNPGGNLRYVITATPVTGGKQQGDTECANFVINSTGAKTNTGTKPNCW
ncbi:MAG: type IV pilin protein [Granulosicoccus sp.]|nr:type IV pilin protein [Granulosicoccus sp.]